MLKSNQHNVTDLLDKDRIIKAILVAESSSVKDVNIDYDALVIGVTLNRRMIKENITGRLKERLGKGMIEEVENLIKRGITLDKLKYFGLEYKFIAMYLNGELNYNDMYQKLNSAICQFAKRQMTWFRKMEKEGITINWLAPNETGKAELLINNFLKV
jgi:tRNA dimethylallyltransferase